MLLPIAAGGMASVWAARLNGDAAAMGFQKIVAIKSMLPELADEAEYRTMFLDEARIASKLHHPNICETFDLGEERGALYMAMEWIDGVSLHRLLRFAPSAQRQPIAPELAARIIVGACAGLHAAHEATDDDGSPLAIVHRDVSPQNILISSDGHVKVMDFGVAQARGKLHATQAGQAKGKLQYMAPEQLRPGMVIDRRADVFALGTVLYEVTTGKKPFDADTDVDVMRAILLRAPVRPSEMVRGYPVELERIIMRAMAKDANERFASAEGLRLALERWLARRVTDREVAALVRDRCGDELEARREALRSASVAEEAKRAPTPAPAAEVGTNAPPAARDRGRQFVIALGVLVVLFGFGSVLRSRFSVAATGSESPRDRPPPASPIAATTPPLLHQQPEEAAATETSAPTSAPKAPPIALRVDPSDAYVVVDGEAIEVVDGRAQIERPRSIKGEMRVVLVKAPSPNEKGYVDKVVVLDASSPETVEVVLRGAEPPALTSR